MTDIGLMLGITPGAFVTGVEPYPAGGLKVYVGPRYMGLYFRVEDEDSIRRVQRAWSGGGHVMIALEEIPTPVYRDAEKWADR